MSGGGTVRNCLIINNTCTSSSTGGGVNIGSGSLVENCTIIRNTGNAGGGVSGSSGSSVKNSIIVDNISPVGQEYSGTISYFTYSCSTPLPSGDGNTNANPRFVDADNGNFRLQPGSPCLNTGSTSALAPGSDAHTGSTGTANRPLPPPHSYSAPETTARSADADDCTRGYNSHSTTASPGSSYPPALAESADSDFSSARTHAPPCRSARRCLPATPKNAAGPAHHGKSPPDQSRD